MRELGRQRRCVLVEHRGGRYGHGDRAADNRHEHPEHEHDHYDNRANDRGR